MSWFDAHTISWSSPGLCWLHQYSATSSISFRVCSVIVAVANPHCLLPSCCHPLAGMNCAELRLRCPELGRCNKRTTSVAAPPASLCGEVAPWPCRTQRSRCGLPVAFPKNVRRSHPKGSSSMRVPIRLPGTPQGWRAANSVAGTRSSMGTRCNIGTVMSTFMQRPTHHRTGRPGWIIHSYCY